MYGTKNLGIAVDVSDFNTFKVNATSRVVKIGNMMVSKSMPLLVSMLENPDAPPQSVGLMLLHIPVRQENNTALAIESMILASLPDEQQIEKIKSRKKSYFVQEIKRYLNVTPPEGYKLWDYGGESQDAGESQDGDDTEIPYSDGSQGGDDTFGGAQLYYVVVETVDGVPCRYKNRRCGIESDPLVTITRGVHGILQLPGFRIWGQSSDYRPEAVDAFPAHTIFRTVDKWLEALTDQGVPTQITQQIKVHPQTAAVEQLITSIESLTDDADEDGGLDAVISDDNRQLTMFVGFNGWSIA